MRFLDCTSLKYGVALGLLGGAFISTSGEAKASEPEAAPKSIKLGVDPDQYLKNRHKRVHRVRRQSQSREARRAAANASGVTTVVESPSSGANEFNPTRVPQEWSGAPGFNEFSYLSGAEKEQAEEIMQFLQNFQPQN